MPQFHLRFDVPDTKPFDRLDWQIQVQGEIVAPFVNTHRPTRFWFSHYGGLEKGKHLLVRYESAQMVEDSMLCFPPSEHNPIDIHQVGGYWVREQSSDVGNNHFGSPLEIEFLRSV